MSWLRGWLADSPPLTRRQFYAAFALLFALVSVALAGTASLGTANQNRIGDIQQSRLESCKRTYESFREVFKPFFRPKAQQTPKERSDQLKFNRTVDRLKARCDTQTATKGAAS